MMASANKCQILSDELRGILSSGLPLNDSTMHYIDSTFADPTVEELQALLFDEDNCESDPLLELIYSPDEATQIRIEAILEKSNFTSRDRVQVAEHLMDPPTIVRLNLSLDRGQLEIPLTNDGARRLIGLLHIERQLDPALNRAVGEFVEESEAARIKVIFRNARCRFCRRDVDLLVRVLKRLDANRQTDIESLEYALTVLTDSPSPADIYQVLMQRKKIYTRQLQTALKRDEMLRKSNPEIMMLQGKPIGGIDTAEARRLIAMIDWVSLAGFKRTEPMAAPALETEIDVRDREDALKFLI